MTQLGGLSDEELVAELRAAADGSDDYFAEIFERYHDRVVGWCYTVSRDRELALDLAQEVFLKVFRSVHAFRGDARISTWMYVITRNHCLNALRKRDLDPTRAAVEIPSDLWGSSGLESYAALEREQSFGKALCSFRRILTPMELRIIWLHYGYELTLSAITRQLLLSNPSGAKAYIVSAKRKLKLHLRRLTTDDLIRI